MSKSKGAATDSSLLSFDQLRDLQSSLRQPLTNREALIPLGPQAFVPGRLTPKLRNDRDQTESTKTEVVWVRRKDSPIKAANGKNDKDDCLEEMTRLQAIDYLQAEMDQFQPPYHKEQSQLSAISTSSSAVSSTSSGSTAKTATTTTKTTTTKTATGSSVLTAGKEPPSNSNHVKTTIQSPHKSQAILNETKEEPFNALPLFEIREELNDEGQEVHSQAINVTQQLQRLEQEIKKQQQKDKDSTQQPKNGSCRNTNNNNNNDRSSTEDALQDATKDSSDVVPKAEKEQPSNSHTEPTLVSETTNELPNRSLATPCVVDDARYNSIQSRLEELARLEEEAERQATVEASTKSKVRSTASQTSKKTKSSGWKKGFLNNNKVPKTLAQSRPSVHLSQAATTTTPSPSSRLPSNSASSTTTTAESATATRSSSAAREEEVRKKVEFSTQGPQVKEIPRVGQRSVREIAKPGTKVTATQPRSETSAFSSAVVQERRRSRQRRGQQQQRQQGGSATTDATTDQPPLSKFAMERRQQQQQ